MTVPLAPLAAPRASPAHPNSRRGEANGASKLSDDDVREIRASTETQHQLAHRYSISQSVISDIRRRRIWAHVVRKNAV